MPTFTKRARAGDPVGRLVVHTPEETVRADRSADGGSWIATATKGSTVHHLKRKGWELAAAAPAPAAPAAKAKTPAKAPAKPKPKAKAKAPAKPKPAPKADTSLLDGSVLSLEEALATGKHDAMLSQLLAAEEAGKTRKGAVSAIKDRMASLG